MEALEMLLWRLQINVQSLN